MANQNLSSRLSVGTANIVVPGTSDGLVSKNGVPGNTTGSAIGSAYVGYSIPSSSTSITLTTSPANTVGLTIPAGVWLIGGNVSYNSGSTANALVNANLTTSQNASDGQLGLSKVTGGVNASGSGSYAGQAVIPPFVVTLAASTNYYLSGWVNANNQSSGQSAAYAYAIRIA